MGSKRSMLKNGLGEALFDSVSTANRVFDLFTGSGAVASHVARQFDKEVIAGDLQKYSYYLAASVITRDYSLPSAKWIDNWFERAQNALRSTEFWSEANALQDQLVDGKIKEIAECARSISSSRHEFQVMRAYGGYYFSPWQAGWLDALRQQVPSEPHRKKVAIAALVRAASKCAASPGHTAQPFKPNATAGKYLQAAWALDLPKRVREIATELCGQHAKRVGRSFCGDAFVLAEQVQDGDLVFVDPPYSGVHYSRFYHVLETIARGEVGLVAGEGRYPPPADRPQSEYSVTSKSGDALNSLLRRLSLKGASVIITFPAGKASNGLSGDAVKELAAQHFGIVETKVSARFSTLGGDKRHRAARQDTHELILSLSPK